MPSAVTGPTLADALDGSSALSPTDHTNARYRSGRRDGDIRTRTRKDLLRRWHQTVIVVIHYIFWFKVDSVAEDTMKGRRAVISPLEKTCQHVVTRSPAVSAPAGSPTGPPIDAASSQTEES
jgi:hypothetical protein